MRVVRVQAELAEALAGRGEGSIGFVPTMGALHAGHASLVSRARAENGLVAVSVFVNPLQFAPHEDLARYPRTEAEDLELLAARGADIVMIGSCDDLLPDDFATTVEVGPALTGEAEGRERPDHFRGVTTIVAKLFGMFRPDRAYFGWKDMQQCCVVRRMVRDLSMPVEVVPCEIVREADGLALSSRNRYLSAVDRAEAPRFHAALVAARDAWRGGERRGQVLTALVRDRLERGFAVDYVEIRDAMSFGRVPDPVAGGRIVAAVRLGTTRLLDNLALCDSDSR